MTVSFRLCRFAMLGAILLAGAGVSGCAAIGDSAMSQAFVDPARYELYSCEQLAAERKSLDARLTELNGLMRKAETGVAGSVVSEVAYRNDYINVKAQSRLAEQTWRDNKCTEAPAAAAAPAVPPAPSPRGRAAR
ncbi:twin-arginine translocation pathway signal [Rhodopseudomonas sp. HC1]|uniref:twin-arginine translocation pathway signal n=1 Tax=Rhodopseudomonas infernalis TaxID=2897386 RepID=UPI001EE85DA4|nr:twin-arginine translocation pathway signal [Rhodopseudomonas infernalis]MCG6206764.1 twin-arginine translocation pathway signal [Rhodopseudomonas infernalis]